MRVKGIPCSLLAAILAALLGAIPGSGQPASERPRNVVIFVADGLRARSVNDTTAPNMAALAREGVFLVNSHALFPTLTMANASAIATGHYLGDTGVFGNTLYRGAVASGSPIPFIENDPVLGELDARFGGNFLNEDTILKLARDKGFSTAAIGKAGPTLLFDHTERSGALTIPERVVAPTRVNFARLRRTLRALGPWSMTISSLKSSIAGYRYSSMAGCRR